MASDEAARALLADKQVAATYTLALKKRRDRLDFRGIALREGETIVLLPRKRSRADAGHHRSLCDRAGSIRCETGLHPANDRQSGAPSILVCFGRAFSKAVFAISDSSKTIFDSRLPVAWI
jgi:hypothetical protein